MEYLRSLVNFTVLGIIDTAIELEQATPNAALTAELAKLGYMGWVDSDSFEFEALYYQADQFAAIAVNFYEGGII